MDYKAILTALLIGHFLGDFYLQGDDMARKKDKDMKDMCQHGLLYLLAIAAAALYLLCFKMPPKAWLLIALVPIFHFFVDLAKHRWPGWERLFKEKAVFMADQAVHISIAMIVAYFCATCSSVAYSKFGICLQGIYAKLDLGPPAHKLVRLIYLFLFMGKPANIFVQNIIKSGRDSSIEIFAEEEQKAGRRIGTAERCLAVILVILGQYSALAFVMAAKTIARFNKISEDQEFAEKYLLGTLSSMLLAVSGAVLYLYIP